MIDLSDLESGERPLFTPKFCYDPRLEGREVRILRLEEGQGDEPLRYTLITECLEDARYHALSHVWGGQSLTRIILCNGQKITVTINLFEALWQLRESKNLTPLWVDAICTNQEDELEKTQQARMMGDIYHFAHQTIILLGPASRDDNLTISMRALI